MIVGVPREIKTGEQRIALTPAGARALVEHGHRVVIEQTAGLGSGIRDDEYAAAGATLATVEAVWADAEMIMKVKEPVPPEYGRLRAGQLVFTYLHLAAVPDLVCQLVKADVIAIGYETVRLATLDEILGSDRPDIIKCNAEGAEFSLIEQLSRTDIRPAFMLLMVHPEFGDENLLVEQARAMGYRRIDIGTPHRPAIQLWPVEDGSF